jgi:hypothetical protein
MSALDYLPAVTMGTKVNTITGVSTDGFTATGYASLIQSITGRPPTLVPLGNKKARILLDEQQISIMKKWLEQRVAAGIKIAKSPSNLDIVAGPFIMPVVLKYAVPACLAVFILGWLTHSFLGKR